MAQTDNPFLDGMARERPAARSGAAAQGLSGATQ
jgi:hypothetical protein